MFRFVSFYWEPGSATQNAAVFAFVKRLQGTSKVWRDALNEESHGFRVLYSDDDLPTRHVHRLMEGRGVILGTLFARQDDERSALVTDAQLSQTVSDRILQSEGRSLIDSFWGSYVAFAQDPAKRARWVVRSPFGSLPCLHTSSDSVHIVFSYLPDILSLNVRPFSINWSYVTGILIKNSRGGMTGLNEVIELRAGECIHFKNGQTERSKYWDPLSAARTEVIKDRTFALDAVRRTVRMCVHSWAGLHQSIVHGLSGGLDSSVVLASLRTAPNAPDIVCINNYSEGPEEDEREYARLVARHLSVELLEMARDPRIDLRNVMEALLSERPQNYIGQLGAFRREIRIATERSATAIFNGTHGDALFYATQCELAAADYLYDHGIGPQLFSVALSAARASRLSVWKVLSTALSEGLTKKCWDPVASSRRTQGLLSDAFLDQAKNVATRKFPWYSRAQYVPQGKQVHVFTLDATNTEYMSFQKSGDPAVISPLLSQPLVELCLRIPTYLHVGKGMDRELERSAFAAELPRKTVLRLSKGKQLTYSAEIVKRNADYIRGLLLDGNLVQRGVLDRKKIEAVLSRHPSGVVQGTARMSRCIDIEIWLRLWANHRAQIAA